MAGHLPSFSNASAIEKCADGFLDPIERLKYLREAAVVPQQSSSWKGWAAGVGLAMVMTTFRSDATNRQAPPRRTASPIVMRTGFHAPAEIPNIWPVEQTNDHDLYSNGLRIENRLAISNEPRSYHLIARSSGAMGPLRAQPAGIVFHTSESDQAPFESDHKKALKRIGQELLLYVRNKRAYHFMIDRFGRVHRLVVESDAANHAGHSIWADEKWAYISLNQSFLGVAFEASMQTDQGTIVTEAQVRAAKALTEMLRAKYNLPAENCVVHAQVSVNPSNRHIGWHTDWGMDFPFRELGLPNNYQIPNPSLYLFGFEYDPAYTNVTGPDLWNGLTAAEERLREAAAERGITPAEYRKVLQQRFRDALSAVHTDPGEEKTNESN